VARRSCITAAVTAAAILLAAAPQAAATATGPMPPPTGSAMAGPSLLRPAPQPAAGLPLASCEHRLERVAGRTSRILAVVGASFTAGVGPGSAARSWAVLLARLLRWDAVVDGVSGAGYVRAGLRHQGPVAAELTRIGLRALDPSLVIIQAGHDDIGVPPAAERRRVRQAISLIRAQAPRARIALITVFTSRRGSLAPQDDPAAAYRTDHAIVAAAVSADHNVIIMDPLTARWVFSRSRDGLHPSAAGDRWIAHTVAGVLRGHGVVAAHRSATGMPLVCDSGIPPERVRPPVTLAGSRAPFRPQSRAQQPAAAAAGRLRPAQSAR
jgi:acyl-CoA thioesterase I